MVSGESDGVAMGKWLWANRVMTNMWRHIKRQRHKGEQWWWVDHRECWLVPTCGNGHGKVFVGWSLLGHTYSSKRWDGCENQIWKNRDNLQVLLEWHYK
jgi:hypothetical protein